MDTSATLLQRLRDRSDSAWQQLCQIYEPLIRRWLRRDAHLGPEEDDLVQEVLLAVFRSIGNFSRAHSGAFHAWLRKITINCLNGHWRKQGRRPAVRGGEEGTSQLTLLEDPASELSRQWDREHHQHLMRCLLDLVRPEVEPSTWEAFWSVEMEGEKPAAVAARLGTSVPAVYLAKSRVLKKLREVGAEILE
jgi:RNA polymerase sigma-70 factor (ECF subfamily)